MKSVPSSFLHHFSSLLMALIALVLDAVGANAAYSSNVWVA
jgi:hypothetical protein